MKTPFSRKKRIKTTLYYYTTRTLNMSTFCNKILFFSNKEIVLDDLLNNLEKYKQIKYSEFISELNLKFKESELSAIKLADKCKLKSTVTVSNAFKKDKQIVSDSVVTKIMEFLNLDGFILWNIYV